MCYKRIFITDYLCGDRETESAAKYCKSAQLKDCHGLETELQEVTVNRPCELCLMHKIWVKTTKDPSGYESVRPQRL
jgi:hypothetical protein